jgi:hypothetical protein
MLRLLISVVAFCLAAGARAQTPLPLPVPPPPLSKSAKGMIGNWVFSNAARSKLCRVTFKDERAAVGLALDFDPACARLFPLVRRVVGWTYPDNDLLYLLNAKGKALVEFSEEEGFYEAPTPGVGVLFLQVPGAGPPAIKPRQVTGKWALKHGQDPPVCIFALTDMVSHDGFALTMYPGCAAGVAKTRLRQWRLQAGQLELIPALGEPWRFERIDNDTWRRLPGRPHQPVLVRQQQQEQGAAAKPQRP